MNTSKTSIGLVGIGLLGTAIAERLLHAQRQLSGYDLDQECTQRFLALGGHPVTSPNELFRNSSRLILSLPNGKVSRSILDRLTQSIRKGETVSVSVVIDTTTGCPDEMIQNATLLAQHGIDYLEATVAGSSAQLAAGEAALFIGGEKRIYQQEESLLALLSAKRFYLGPAGSASRFKLVHNLFLGLHRAVLAEGLAFAELLGFDLAQTLEIIQQTPAASQVMQTKGRKMIQTDWTPQAKLSQHLKDVKLILEAVEQSGGRAPLSQVHRLILEKCIKRGFGDADNSAILEAYRVNQQK